jgi:hypothetical protein
MKVSDIAMLKNMKHLPVMATKAGLRGTIKGKIDSRLRGDAQFWQRA